jgi:predicted esterase
LIWLSCHGINCVESIDSFLDKKQFGISEGLKIVLPSARDPVTGRQRCWYRVGDYSLPLNDMEFNKFVHRFDQVEVQQSVKMITELLKQEIKALNGDASKVFIGGIQEGCGIALATWLQF